MIRKYHLAPEFVYSRLAWSILMLVPKKNGLFQASVSGSGQAGGQGDGDGAGAGGGASDDGDEGGGQNPPPKKIQKRASGEGSKKRKRDVQGNRKAEGAVDEAFVRKHFSFFCEQNPLLYVLITYIVQS
jgi:hypothetical protein